MRKVKLYRFTVEHIEYVPVRFKPDIVTYRQTNWHSVHLVPRENEKIVKVEEKVIEVSDKCLRRR